MLRQIIRPLESTLTLQLPPDMIGKTVEIIAFELKEADKELLNSNTEKSTRLARIQEITKKSLVDLSNFNFDRNEANNYAE